MSGLRLDWCILYYVNISKQREEIPLIEVIRKSSNYVSDYCLLVITD